MAMTNEVIKSKLTFLFMANREACIQTLNHLASAGYDIQSIDSFEVMAEIYLQALPSLVVYNPKVFEVVKELL